MVRRRRAAPALQISPIGSKKFWLQRKLKKIKSDTTVDARTSPSNLLALASALHWQKRLTHERGGAFGNV